MIPRSPMKRILFHRYYCYQLTNTPSTIRRLFTILASCPSSWCISEYPRLAFAMILSMIASTRLYELFKMMVIVLVRPTDAHPAEEPRAHTCGEICL
jgi:hypothetical protein